MAIGSIAALIQGARALEYAGNPHAVPDLEPAETPTAAQINHAACTGYGVLDSHAPAVKGDDGVEKSNGNPRDGTPYDTIRWPDIRALMATPMMAFSDGSPLETVIEDLARLWRRS